MRRIRRSARPTLGTAGRNNPTVKRLHSQKAWAVLITGKLGGPSFLSTGLGLATAPTRKQADGVLRKWREIAGNPGLKARVTRVIIQEVP